MLGFDETKRLMLTPTYPRKTPPEIAFHVSENACKITNNHDAASFTCAAITTSNETNTSRTVKTDASIVSLSIFNKNGKLLCSASSLCCRRLVFNSHTRNICLHLWRSFENCLHSDVFYVGRMNLLKTNIRSSSNTSNSFSITFHPYHNSSSRSGIKSTVIRDANAKASSPSATVSSVVYGSSD